MEGWLTEYNPEFWDIIDSLVQQSEVIIDRPKETRHPKYPNIFYEVDYGYLKNRLSMDGGGIDIWRVTNKDQKIDAIICTVD